jgi:hypothetical protein
MHNKSTQHNLIQLTNFINTALDEKKYAIGIFCDLKKAFEVCSHSILIENYKNLSLGTQRLNGSQVTCKIVSKK